MGESAYKLMKLILAIALLCSAYAIYDQQYLTIREHETRGMVQYGSIGLLDIRPISIIPFVIGVYLLVGLPSTPGLRTQSSEDTTT